ncbi:MAG: pyridoxal-phosphate dependent enzyme [Anaerolineales bacterium]|nr:pyridoxal-phosphate dependent enzyme [Anaerolineales bacterium]
MRASDGGAAAPPFRCANCGRQQPLSFGGGPCPVCGGVLDLAALPRFDPAQVDQRAHGVWRYRHTFPLPPEAAPVTLGEGGTPLVAAEVGGRTVHFKLEYLQPTGSFKDRGMAVTFTALRAAGIPASIEDSSGNAGAAFAGYAARAGIRARVFVPAAAAGPKRAQIAAFGAEVVAVDGPRSAAAEAALAAVRDGAHYGSHIYNPTGLAGNATAAYELWEQLGHAPGLIVLPVGHGTLLLGLQRGFKALASAGLIERLPRLVGVQALACAPLWAVQRYGREGLALAREGATAAEGIRVVRPVRGDAVLAALRESGGTLVAVDEPEIVAGQNALARLGFYVETTSAVVWPALTGLGAEAPDGEVVVMLTGSGLKNKAA